MLSGEATHFKVFGLIRPEFEPTIYCTRGEHTNHYTIDAVAVIKDNFFILRFKILSCRLVNWGIHVLVIHVASLFCAKVFVNSNRN